MISESEGEDESYESAEGISVTSSIQLVLPCRGTSASYPTNRSTLDGENVSVVL